MIVEGHGGVGPMLNKMSDDIAECYRHAEDCARRAQGECEFSLRQDFLDLERRWLGLARSYEFTDRLQRFRSRRPTPR